MKYSPVAHYSARGGVYIERRLRKSTQFVVGGYAVVIGVVLLLANQGFNLGSSAQNVRTSSQQSRLVSQTTSRGLAQPTDQPVPQPDTQPDAQAATDTVEASRLSAAVAAAKSQFATKQWSVAVYDLQSNDWLLKDNAERQYTSASLYKLYAVYGLAQKVPPSQWSTVMVAGRSLESCVDVMLRLSDNECGDAVGSYVGWSVIDRYIHAAGYNGTRLNRPAGPITTAQDTTQFMAALYQDKLFDASTTSRILNSLQQQKYRQAIPAGCANCQTYNKTGNDNKVTHDSAIVTTGSRSYAVTIMSEDGGSYDQIAAVERAIQSVVASQ